MAYTNGIYYIDLVNGSDAARTALTGVIATDNGSGGVRMTKAGHGLVTGAIVVASAFTAYLNGSWKITYIDADNFDLDTAVWATTADPNGTITPNGGSSWADAWLTMTLGATAARIQPGDTMRISKTPNPVSIGNATWNNKSRTITLAAARTATIIQDGTWTIAAGGDVATAVAQAGKASATSTTRFTFDAAIQNSVLQAYIALGTTLDLSAYQQISFHSLAPNANLTVNSLVVCLCSDTAGAVIVDSFLLPARFMSNTVFTLPREGGGNLGNNINSIALYTGTAGSTSGLASKYFHLDNIIACKTGDLSFCNPISKNGNAYGGDEGYYTLSSILGTTLVLDGLNLTAIGFTGYKYYGATETVETFVREVFKTPLTTQTGVVMAMTEAGTVGNLISYEFGYNTSTNEQDGETHVSGSSQYGYCSRNLNYTSINRISCYRFYMALYPTGTNTITIGFINTLNCCGYGIYAAASMINSYFETIKNITCCGQGAFTLTPDNSYIGELGNVSGTTNNGIVIGAASSYSSGGLYIGKIGKVCGQSNASIYIQNSGNVLIGEIGEISDMESGSNLFLLSSIVVINKLGFAGGTGNNAINVGNLADLTIHECGSVAKIENYSGFVKIMKLTTLLITPAHYRTSINNFVAIHFADETKSIYVYNGIINYQTAVKHLSTDIGSWYIEGSATSLTPIKLKMAEVAFEANKLVYIQVWVKKTHISGVIGLTVNINKMVGIDTEIIATETTSTDWQALTITFTPTAYGVCEVYINAYSVSANVGYIAPIYATQSV
jgi:hypothetical protein